MKKALLLLACSSMLFMQQDLEVCAVETGNDIWTNDYESSVNSQQPIYLSVNDLTFKDMNGNIVNTNEYFTYSYAHGEKLYPQFDIYYNNTRLGYTYDEDLAYWATNHFSSSFYKLNPLTGSYEYLTWGEHECDEIGTYQMILTMSDAEINESDEAWSSVSRIYHLQDQITINFTVTPKDITDIDVVYPMIENQIYDGDVVYPEVDISISNHKLVPNIEYSSYGGPYYNDEYDYIITYSNNDKVGQATITIEGVGNYTGTKVITFGIFKDISLLEFNEIKNYAYTGKEITPTVKVKDGDTTLKKDMDYSISYVNNKDYGEASIVITGMGYYTGEKVLYFGIVPKKVTNIKIASPKKLQAKITWEKSKGADGYLIERYDSKKEQYVEIGVLKNGNWRVFEDGAHSLKNNQKYKYRITPFVLSKNNGEYYLGKSATKSGKVTKDYKELNIPILTGDVNVDYAAEVICNKVIKKNMSQQEKVRALYDWVVDNCTHDKNYDEHEIVYDYEKNAKKAKAYSEKMWKKIYKGEAECNFDGMSYSYYNMDSSYNGYQNNTLSYGTVDGYYQFDRTELVFQTHQGGCSYITRLFKVLVNHVGIECTLVEGDYVNTKGQSMFHVWSYIRVNKKYAWYDVDVATSNKKVRNTWYKRDTKFWDTCHDWDEKSIPRGVPSSLKK